MLANIGDYDERVRQGKKIEWRILNNLRAKLKHRDVRLEDPTSSEDVQSKIDAWLGSPKSKRYSVQIKYRETGDDLIFEVVKNTATWTLGRDLRSVAQLYLVVDRGGTARLYWTAPIKVLAKKLMEEAKIDLTTEPSKIEWSGNGYEMKRTIDRAQGNSKIVAFFDPTRFDAIETWEGLI